MSRQIDPEHMTADDVEYVRQRPMVLQEFAMQGLPSPVEPDYPFLVDEDGNFVNEGQPSLEDPVLDNPDMGQMDEDGFPLNTDREKPENWNDLSDEEKRAYVYDDPEDGDETPEELPVEKQWNEDMNKAELYAVIAARNADYDEDEQIVVEKDNKDSIFAALQADDAELAEGNNE